MTLPTGDASFHRSLIEQSQCGGMKNPPRARLGYSRATGERMVVIGATIPLAARAAGGKYHQFLWTASQPIQFCDKGTVRSGANLEAASEPSQVQGQFRALHRCSYPEGYGCYCKTRTQRSVPAGPPCQKARPAKAGRERDAAQRGAGESGKARKTSSLGRREKPRHPTSSRKQPES